MNHAYIHVPFCSGKCTYCAAYSRRYAEQVCGRYLAALATEIGLRVAAHGPLSLDTLYLGGGTPTVLSADALRNLFAILSQHVQLRPGAEVTVEGGPGTFDADKLEVLLNAGVNRVSVGAQSFDDGVLAAAGRRHTAADTLETAHMLRRGGVSNIGLDLIAGLPGCDAACWVDSLKQAAALNPAHVSVYALTVEEGTELHRRLQGGTGQTSDDATLLSALAMAEAHLADAGYARYELSNYARPGFQCRHNLAYWRGADFIGFGPSASSRVGRERWTNVADLEAYCAMTAGGVLPAGESETVDAATDCTERLLYWFRLAEGVDVEAHCEVHGETGRALREPWLRTLSDLQNRGIVACTENRWRLTARGREVANAVLEALLPS